MSVFEAEYTLHGVEQDIREDGRGRLDWRNLTVELGLLPQTSGSARLSSGASGVEVLVGVVAALSEPHEAHPDLGLITVGVSCGPGDAAAALIPDYTAASFTLDEKRLWIEEALCALYGPRSVPEVLRTLCIVPGRQCWELRVHVQLLRADGWCSVLQGGRARFLAPQRL